MDYNAARRRVEQARTAGEAERRRRIADGLEELAREVRAGEHNELILVEAVRLIIDGTTARRHRRPRGA